MQRIPAEFREIPIDANEKPPKVKKTRTTADDARKQKEEIAHRLWSALLREPDEPDELPER